ncbi:hypothetical protein NHX12_029772 [Muraenolepis orangiensis]|uniref:Uncharacterized protein n=1 Tax=Muraenolepis orangiensis TaxID=630683 RepID=A0A9Q0ECM4_9TELE|nr:hypothetical protein NHX12_029772 [Muraenolepis orangiensis]
MFMRPTMTPPNPPSQPPALEEDFTLLKPPPMSPPKPPSTYTSALPSISAQPSSMIPELPKFAPPKPPSEYQPKSGKTPPPKPNRLSSIAGVEGFIQPTSPAATSQMSTPSSFNPQNTAKLYNSPKTSILSGHGDSDTRPKQILLIQDSCPVPVQLNGNPSPAPPSKPIRGTAPGTQLDLPKVNLQANMPSKTPQLQPKSQDKTVISMLQENNHAPSLPQVASKFIKAPLTPVSSLDNAMFAKSPSQKCKFSPLIDRKLRNLKGPETSRDGSPASPLALLQAAKERDKYRSSVLLENGPQSSANIHHSDSTPNSFVVIPKSTSISPTTSKKGLEEDSKSTVPSLGPMATTQTQALRNAPPSVRSPLAPTTPALSGTSRAATSPSFGDPSLKQNIKQSTPSFDTKREANQPEVNMALLPPPPAFANFDFGASVDSPPDFPPPDPPAKKAPSPTAKPVNSAPAPPPKPNATARPAPVQDVKPQVTYQIFPKVPIAKPLPAVSESQATLLSILQKKMLEMENTMIPKKDTESSSDEWGSPLPEDETRFPFAPRTTPPRLPAKTPSLDMRELETKVAKKQQVNSSVTR